MKEKECEHSLREKEVLYSLLAGGGNRINAISSNLRRLEGIEHVLSLLIPTKD